jgi:deazaflavin-dependent oxidoreductase (nitroreductase family)
MVMITHRGRKTGKRRHTCLEVAHRDEVTGEIVVFSSRGERADWYRNLVAAPAVGVQVGRRRYKPRQRFLPPDEALAVLREYAGRRLAVAKRLAPGGTDEELQPSPNGRAWWRSAGEQRAMSDERPVIDERADLNLVQLNNSYQRFSRVGGK